MDESARRTLMQAISKMQSGSDIDRLVATVAFDCRLEPCDVVDTGYHVVGAFHYKNPTTGGSTCTIPLPRFSTDPTQFHPLLEWVTRHFPGFELVYDCGKWSSNVNGQAKDGHWYRLSHVAGVSNMQEAICKAILLTVVSPQKLPLDIRVRVSMSDAGKTPPKKRRNAKRKSD